ncbi:MAG: 2TM domain-containing protein [Actinomycetota bacterium]|nr:2TM domain-containing protein [Actinomycetota bacterium]
MPFCNKCGDPVEEGDRFCHSCGAATTKVGMPATPSSPAATPPPLRQPVPTPAMAAAWPESGWEREPTLEERAEKRVRSRIELLQHLGIYIAVNAFLVVVWALSGVGYPWFLWPLAAWGMGLTIHIISYFIGSEKDTSRQRMVEKEMERIKLREQVASQDEQSPPPYGEGAGE